MTVPDLKKCCQMCIIHHIVGINYDNHNFNNGQSLLLHQLDNGAWGLPSNSILEKVVSRFGKCLKSNVILSLLPDMVKELCLKECPHITAQDLNSALNRCGQLKRLDLSDNPDLSFNDVNLFGRINLSKSLTSVSLENCTQVNDQHIQTLLRNVPILHNLNIAWCSITDNVFLLNKDKQLAREAGLKLHGIDMSYDSRLESVDVSRCSEFSSTGVRHLCTLCGPTLKSIDLTWTKVDSVSFLYLSGMGLPAIAEFFMSSNTVPSEMTELLVYQLHQFDIICSDILHKYQNDNGSVDKNAHPGVFRSSNLLQDQLSACESNFNTHSYTLYLERQLEKHDLENAVTNTNQNSASQPTTEIDNEPKFHVISLDQRLDSSTQMQVKKLCESMNCCPLLAKGTDRTNEVSYEEDGKNEVKHSDIHVEVLDVEGANIDTDVETGCDNKETDITAKILRDVECVSVVTTHLHSDIKCVNVDTNVGECVNVETTKIGSGAECVYVNTNLNIDSEQVDVETTNIDSVNAVTTNEVCDTKCVDGNTNILNDAECVNTVTTNIGSDFECVNILGKDDDNPNVLSSMARISMGLHSISPSSSSLHDNSVISSCKLSTLSSDSSEKVSTDNFKKSDQLTTETKGEGFFTSDLNRFSINAAVFHEETLAFQCFLKFLTSNHEVTSINICSGITGNFMSDNVLDLIGSFARQLQELCVQGGDQLTDSGMKEISKNCLFLSSVDLTGVSFIGDEALIPLIESVSLTHLKLAETRITENCVNHMATLPMAQNLKEIDFSWCEEIESETAFNNLISSCPQLKKLNLRECCISNDTLLVIAKYSHCLTHLSLASNMSVIRDEGLIAITEGLPNLINIDLGWNSYLTNPSIESLLRNCRYLVTANLEGLKLITSIPFMPVISMPDELVAYLEKQSESELEQVENVVKLSDLPCLPHRSTLYATNLQEVNLTYCDFVEDCSLQQIVTVTHGGIQTRDYYGNIVEPAQSSMETYLKEWMEARGTY